MSRLSFRRREIIDIMVQLTRGVDYLHSKNILHKDLKPANILFEGDVLKIADFGVSRQLPPGEFVVKTCKYTPEYASPELILQKRCFQYEPDIWSIGCILYELCTLRRPFDSVKDLNHFFHGKYSKRRISGKLARFIPILNKIFETNLTKRIKIGELRRNILV